MSRILPVFVVLLFVGCSEPTPAPGADAGQDGALSDAQADGLSADSGPVDPCEGVECSEANRSVCTAEGGAPACVCDAGFEERDGSCEAMLECTEATCGSNGDCRLEEGGPVCDCALGRDGRFCENCDATEGYYDDGTGRCTQNACEPNPCEDPERMRCEVYDERAVCECNAGTHAEGDACVIDVVCSDTSCDGHGVCSMSEGVIECECELGFGGERCEGCDETNGYHADGVGGCTTDVCLPNLCVEPMRTVCIDDAGTPRCQCDAGAHEEDGRCVADETCEASTCSGHGSCTVTMGRAECMCDVEWDDGAECAECAAGYHADGAGGCTMDACLPNPCDEPLMGVCVAVGATAVCECDAGAHPDGAGGCTTDPCLPNRCLAMNQSCRVVGDAAECFTPACTDDNPCTDDEVVGGVCVHTPLANGSNCDDNICVSGQTCTAAVCGGGSAVVCDDGNACTADSCDVVEGCVSVVDDTLTPPDDGIPCTVGRCEGGGAVHTESDAMCDDGLYCTGAEYCVPGPGADAAGCVADGPPSAPGPSTPCAMYSCDEGSDSFVLDTLAPGAACDDGIACTTGDVCSASSVCLGSPTATCGGGTTCASTGPLGPTFNIGVAQVSGTITQNGGLLPIQSSSSTDGILWAVSKDTAAYHQLHNIDWGARSPSYSRPADDDTYASQLIPGVYDIVYTRNYTTGSTFNRVYAQNRTPGDAAVNAYRVVQSDVVVPAGGRIIDIDIGVTQITGTITQNGGLLPIQSSSSTDGLLWAVSKDTGAYHQLHNIDWG
ncbi:MAG: hypothetical protein AB8H86_00560, partial [Polyangiales bacterium]